MIRSHEISFSSKAKVDTALEALSAAFQSLRCPDLPLLLQWI